MKRNILDASMGIIIVILLITCIVMFVNKNDEKCDTTSIVEKENDNNDEKIEHTEKTEDIENNEKCDVVNNYSGLLIGFQKVVSIQNGKLFVMSILREGWHSEDNYYELTEVENNVGNIINGYTFNLGYDPTRSFFFLTDDGKVLILAYEGTSPNLKYFVKVCSEQNNKYDIVSLKMINEEEVHGITSDGKEVNIIF